MTWHLGQLNIGRLRAEVDDPSVAEFMDNLDPINALAEASPGPPAVPAPRRPVGQSDERNACPV